MDKSGNVGTGQLIYFVLGWVFRPETAAGEFPVLWQDLYGNSTAQQRVFSTKEVCYEYTVLIHSQPFNL